MEEIRLVLEETAEDVDRKLEEIERSKYELVEGVKEYGGGKDEDLSVSVSDEDQLGVTSSRDDDMVRRRRSSSEDMMRRRRSSSSEDMMPRRRRSSSSSEDLVRLRRSSSSSEDLVRRRRSSSDEDMALRSSSDGEDQGGDDNRKADEDEDDDETEEDEDETEEDDDETEEEDDTEEWDENDGRWLPYSSRCLDPRALCTAGAGCTPEMAETIAELVDERNGKMLEAWLDIVNDNRTPLPARPVPILPKITTKCASGGVCYHREYWTDITSETEPNHPCFRPCEMLQVFSLRLSSTLAHSVNIYGTFAVRDCWEPCRNYLFRRSRDDPATIEPGCSFLPLCSPCRGIFVFQYLLLDIDLWIKEEGSIFPDRPLFSGYIELDAHLSGFGSLLKGRIQNGPLGLDMHYAFLYDGIETVIEVLAAAEYPSNVKISALTSGFDDEIALYDAIFCGTGVVARHFMSVRKLQMLHVFMKLDDSIYKWTFLAGVGVLAAPDGPISGFAQFEVNVSFRTKGKAASAWQWRGICNENVAEMCL